jgi:hypothetical protein
MDRINFDAEYVAQILAGTKRTTVRKGIRNYSGIAELTCEGEAFTKVRINKVLVKRVGQLKEKDAIEDGFESVDELKTALRRIYGSLEDDDFITIVYFEPVD